MVAFRKKERRGSVWPPGLLSHIEFITDDFRRLYSLSGILWDWRVHMYGKGMYTHWILFSIEDESEHALVGKNTCDDNVLSACHPP